MAFDLSIIIPVYNSAPFLESVVDDLLSNLKPSGKTIEVILVDDGSTDNSWEVIKTIRKKNAEVRGFRLSKNYGQHKAIFCGMHQCSGEVVITMDDDFEHPSAQILPIAAELLNSNNDIIYASSKKNRNRGFFRTLATKIYRFMSKVESPTGGEGSSFRFLKKELVKNICTHSGHLFILDELVLWHTSYIGRLNIEYGVSKRRVSTYSYFTLVTLSKDIFILSTLAPLVFVRFLGISVSSISFIIGLYYLLRKIIFKVPSGYTSIIVSILFSTGLILFCLAIIGEYLGNILMMQNQKPAYTIKEEA